MPNTIPIRAVAGVNTVVSAAPAPTSAAAPPIDGNALAPAPALLTITQAAARLQVDERTLRRMIDAGRCPAPIRLSRQIVRINVETWEAWIAGGCVDCRKRGGR